MNPIKLDLDSLSVSSFETSQPMISSTEPGILDPIGYCCTGCVSGCGINPTASGCASGGTDPYAVQY